MVAPADRATLLQQRGLLLLRAGRIDAAQRQLDAVLPALAQDGEPVVLARTLLNRAVSHLTAGRIRLARADLERCRELAQRHGLDLIAAKCLHNIGYCEMLAGDIPAALRSYDAAAGSLRRLGATGLLPVSTLDRSRALLAAGLDREAGRELEAAIELFRQQRLAQDHAEAELARAQAALYAGDLAAARWWSGRAARRFTRRGNPAWAALAGLVRVRVDLVTGRASARQAGALATTLRSLGLRHDAETADLLSVRATLAAGRTATPVPATRDAPVEVRVLRRLTRAESHLAAHRRGAAFAELRAGLADLQGYRSRFGSLDLQSGTATLGVELAGTGLEAAWRSGSPRLVFGWSERCRAQVFRIHRVRPPADAEIADALAELRQLRLTVRAAELAGEPDLPSRARCTELERLIRQRGWQLDGTRESAVVEPYRTVRDELAATGRALVSYLIRAGRLHALVLAGGAVTVLDLGGYDPVAEAVRKLLADLNAVANTRLPERLAAVVRTSIRRRCAFLDAELVAPLRRYLPDGDLVVLPTRLLSMVPWGLLPGLARRPVTVAPSASAWLAARRRSAHMNAGGPPLLVAGPDLAHAGAEVAAIATRYPKARALYGAAATTGATLVGMDGAALVHLAAHGSHDPDNPLFSRLHLADGPLMAYDLQQLDTAPTHVVLSACDLGRAIVRAGDELLGFTAALLYAGTATVIASVARVPDEAAADLMARYHEELADGAQPARALAATTDRAPFVCFGAG
jgi:hypothetical protein